MNKKETLVFQKVKGGYVGKVLGTKIRVMGSTLTDTEQLLKDRMLEEKNPK